VRLGRIPWINCYPIYRAIDRGVVPMPADLVTATAAELNDLLAAGELDVSVVSAVEYARNASAYQLLPDLAISCDGPVHSVALFSRVPLDQLDGATILRTASSRTSVLLLDLLCRHRWGIAPRFASVRAEPQDLAGLAAMPHDAVLVIGDAALQLQTAGHYPVVVDLGDAWKAWTGLPFVFAVWAARREAPADLVGEVARRLLESRQWGLGHLDDLATEAARDTGVPLPVCRSYLGDIDYALGERHLEGLSAFFARLVRDGVVPDGALSFISAA
jgi:chorismate dehydratase